MRPKGITSTLLSLAALGVTAVPAGAQSWPGGERIRLSEGAEARLARNLPVPVPSLTLQPPAFAGQLGSTSINILLSLNRVDLDEAGTLITLHGAGFLRVRSSPSVAGAVLQNGNYAVRLTMVHLVDPTTITWRAFSNFPSGPAMGTCQLPRSLLYNQPQICDVLVPVTNNVLDIAASWGSSDGLVLRSVTVSQLP